MDCCSEWNEADFVYKIHTQKIQTFFYIKKKKKKKKKGLRSKAI